MQTQTTTARWTPWPWIATLAVLAATVGLLRYEGRHWWCACGEPWPWISNVWSRHCSQHLLDPYSLTHLSHGVIFYGFFALVIRRCPVAWRFFLSITLAAGWEVLENSSMIINRYRAATMSLDYLGDSVLNSLGDIGSCAVGFWVARRLGVMRSLALFVATELILLVLIRDNLSLNVLMLIYPVDAVRHWQSAGHVP